MDDRPGGPTADRDDDRCPACGSRHVHYHVTRTGGWSRPAPERSLVWECRDCQTRWTERLVAFFNDDPSSETSSGREISPPGTPSGTPPRNPKDPI